MNPFEESLLHYLRKDHLDRIRSVRIGIGGSGGLGSNVALILVRTGFRDLEILDEDRVEPSNLNRQQYTLADLGKRKVMALAARLREINPDLRLSLHARRWTPEDADLFFKGCSVVVEAFDRAPEKCRFVEAYQGRASFVVSGNGMAGLEEKGEMIVLRRGNIFLVGDQTTDTTAGHPPLAPRVTACAAKMAEIVLDLTLSGLRP